MAADSHGRGLAASALLANGASLRLLGLYGVTGSCLPGFQLREEAKQQEAQLNLFVRSQSDWAHRSDSILVAAGDFNSIYDEHLDAWGGTASPREGTLIHTLLDCGMVDLFRQRHPRLRAFTFFPRSGGASRLDGICWRPTPHSVIHGLNAAIVWNWPRHTDHAPVVADLSWPLALVPDPEPNADRRWRSLISDLGSSRLGQLQGEVAASIEPHKAELLQLQTHLRGLCLACGREPSGAKRAAVARDPFEDKLEGLMPWLAGADYRTLDMLHQISQIHERIRQLLLQALPVETSGDVTSRQVHKASASWDHVLCLLREARTASQLCCVGGRWVPATENLLSVLQDAWDRARRQLAHLLPARATPAPSTFDCSNWDGFYSRAEAWALDRAFPADVAAQWRGAPAEPRGDLELRAEPPNPDGLREFAAGGGREALMKPDACSPGSRTGSSWHCRHVLRFGGAVRKQHIKPGERRCAATI